MQKITRSASLVQRRSGNSNTLKLNHSYKRTWGEAKKFHPTSTNRTIRGLKKMNFSSNCNKYKTFKGLKKVEFSPNSNKQNILGINSMDEPCTP